MLGREGLKRVSEFSTLNANYLMARLKEAGVIDAAIVGEVFSHPEQRIVVE